MFYNSDESMKHSLLLGSVTLLLNGCAVVTTADVVGAAAVSVTTTAVGLTYDATKAVATGTYAVGELAVEAMSSPKSTPIPNASTPAPHEVEVSQFKE